MAEGSPWYKFARWVVRHVFFGALGGLKAVTPENVPLTGPVLIAPVHISTMDPPLIGCACPRQLCFMAKKELFEKKLFAKLITSLGAFPVERGANDSAAIRQAIDILKSGRTLLVFPEGTRGDGVSMGEVKAGIAMLAKRSEAVVVPVGVVGSHKMMPKGQKGIKRARVTVVFGRPMKYTDFESAEGDPRLAFTDALVKEMHRACAEGGLDLKPFSATDQEAVNPSS
jgi:1-acyl-sn-glycerol-3-phosphate acyltransferase